MKNIYVLAFLSFLMACSYTQKIRDGKTAYERKQYAVAIPMLKKELAAAKTRLERGKLAYMLAESYQFNSESGNAITYFKQAYDNQYGLDALRAYAFALKANEQYDEAVEAFKNLGVEIGSPYEYKKEILACQNAKVWKEWIKYNEFVLEKVKFNSSASDYSPTLYKDGDLVITSDRNNSTGEQKYKWTGQKYSDLFLVDVNSGTAKNFSSHINTPFNEATIAFNADFTEAVFTRCSGENPDENFCKLYYSKNLGEDWSSPEVLNFCKENVNYGHPALSADGKTLYFSSNDPDGWGEKDIYVTSKSNVGWQEPKVLSRSINTQGNEMFPSIDGDTLYFASDYWGGMGGLDIYKSWKTDGGNWTLAQNLKAPINSNADDFGLVIFKQENQLASGYFTSTREGGEGNEDIYKFQKRIPPTPPAPPKKDTTSTSKKPAIVYKLILEGYVLEKIFQNADNPNSKVIGRKPLANASVEVISAKGKKTFTSNEEGFFTFEMEENTDYTFVASSNGYLNNQTKFSTKGIARNPQMPTQKFDVEVVLDKIFKNKEIVLENIYYDYDRWEIREDAKPTLLKLAETLNQNPSIKIQLSSHTDCRGNDTYNADLSQKRAQSAVDFLISQGIASNRLYAKGFGESQPAVSCLCNKCTDSEHQANRRTAFAIVE